MYIWATTAQPANKTKRPADGGSVYSFASPGTRGVYRNIDVYSEYHDGHEKHPVTNVTWRDAVVWCNALTEYYNSINGNAKDLDCVSMFRNAVIRDSRDSNAAACDNAVRKNGAAGFRLPTSIEWEYAARYNGADTKNSIFKTACILRKEILQAVRMQIIRTLQKHQQFLFIGIV